jgi:hypothetical protein
MSDLKEITLVNGKPIASTKIKDARSAYQGEVDEIRTMVFENLPIDEGISRSLDDIALYSLTRDNGTGHGSGVVVAGYGTKQIFPALESMRVDGVFGDILKFRSLQISAIGRDAPAAIIPFAQSEMVVAFMEGSDPEYQGRINAKVPSHVGRLQFGVAWHHFSDWSTRIASRIYQNTEWRVGK